MFHTGKDFKMSLKDLLRTFNGFLNDVKTVSQRYLVVSEVLKLYRKPREACGQNQVLFVQIRAHGGFNKVLNILITIMIRVRKSIRGIDRYLSEE